MPVLLTTKQEYLCFHKTEFQVLLCVRTLHEAPGLVCQLKSALTIPISIHNGLAESCSEHTQSVFRSAEVRDARLPYHALS